jgi:hypothetical protein
MNSQPESDLESSSAELGGKTPEVSATWAVGVVGGDWELGEIAPHLAGNIRISRADDGWELTSDAFDGLTEAETVRAFAQETLALLNGLAAIWLEEPGSLQVGNVRRYRPNGTKDVWVFPEPIALRLRVGTPSVLINDVAVAAPSWIPDLELAANDASVQAVLAFLGGTVTWHDLYSALEVILQDVRTDLRAGVIRWAGVSDAQLRLFTQTANSYSAIGTAARHGPRFRSPTRPMEMSDAKALISGIARAWLEQLTATPRT